MANRRARIKLTPNLSAGARNRGKPQGGRAVEEAKPELQKSKASARPAAGGDRAELSSGPAEAQAPPADDRPGDSETPEPAGDTVDKATTLPEYPKDASARDQPPQKDMPASPAEVTSTAPDLAAGHAKSQGSAVCPAASPASPRVRLPIVGLKHKFRPNLCEDNRGRRARNVSGNEPSRRQRALSGQEDKSPAVKRHRVLSGSASGTDDEETFPKPPPVVARKTHVEASGLPATPLLLAEESENRKNADESGGAVRRARRLTGPKSVEKSVSQFMRRKADHRKKFQKGVPERGSMTMFDLIYYNPEHGHRMSIDEPDAPDVAEEEAVEEQRADDPVVEDDESRDEMPVPQVKVGPDGEIVLDEASTVIETTAAKKAKLDLQKSPLVFETSNKMSNYGTWSKKRRHNDWSSKETLKFYRALSVVGTDFSMMESLFKNRNRQELKLKFKKEEKINNELIDRCLSQQGQYIDLDQVFQDTDEEEEEEEVQVVSRRKKKRSNKTRKGNEKFLKNVIVSQ